MKFAVKTESGRLLPIIGHTENMWIVLNRGQADTRLFAVDVCAGNQKWWERLVLINSAAIPPDRGVDGL